MNSTASLDDVREAVTTIDAYSQEIFGRIVAIAALCDESLNSKRSLVYGEINQLQYAFRAIRSMAEECKNDINVEAEQVGCHYVPPERKAALSTAAGDHP